MRVAVIIPAYNEEKTIGKVIKEIPREFEDLRIIVVDDGSTDNTSQVAKEAGADKIVRFRENRGLGIAMKKGIEEALYTGADIYVNIDADDQFNSGDIPKLIEPIEDGYADLAMGSRFLDQKPEIPEIKKIGNILLTKLINFITNKELTDTQCGFWAYTREAALHLNIFSRLGYTSEALLDLIDKDFKIVEVACKVKPRADKSRLISNVLQYGLQVFIIIIRAVRDYKPLKFFGIIGASVFLLGAMPLFLLFLYWLSTGNTAPYTSLITVSVLFLILGFLLIVLALMADMSSRQRKIQEEILYYNKLQYFAQFSDTQDIHREDT